MTTRTASWLVAVLAWGAGARAQAEAPAGEDLGKQIEVVARHDRVNDFARAAAAAKAEVGQPGGPRRWEVAQACIAAYDAAVKAGAAPTEVVAAFGLRGTLLGLREQWCAPALAQLQASEERRAAPYRRVLRNDKLAIALRETAYVLLPSGARVTPERLAAARVWFEDATPEQLCANGLPVHTLWRFEFDADQRLVKQSHRAYCGHPPDAAWE
jgi:hypothetical protein